MKAPFPLAPFIPGSITEQETYHVRVMRTLSADSRRDMQELALTVLFGEKAEQKEQPVTRRLTLVVNNG